MNMCRELAAAATYIFAAAASAGACVAAPRAGLGGNPQHAQHCSSFCHAGAQTGSPPLPCSSRLLPLAFWRQARSFLALDEQITWAKGSYLLR